MPSLDLGANSFRQNGSIKDDRALASRQLTLVVLLVWTNRLIFPF